MTPKPPCSSGCTISSTPPAPAAASTTTAAPAIPDFRAPDSAPASGWERGCDDSIQRGPYRVLKWYLGRPQQSPVPVYQAFHRFAFLGTFPSAAAARACCQQHEADHA